MVSTLLAIYLFIDPERSFLVDIRQAVPVSLFIVIGFTISAVTEVLRQTIQKLAKAEAQKSLLLEELGHRTKNELFMVSSVLSLQAKAQNDPNVKAALQAAVARVSVIARAHDRLRGDKDGGTVEMAGYLADLCQNLGDVLRDVRPIAVLVHADNVQVSSSDAVSIGLIAEGSSDGGGSIWDWLFGSDVPEHDRRLYEGHLARGGAAVSVFIVDAPGIADFDRVEGLLQQHNPVEMHEENAAGSTAEAAGSGSATGQGGSASQSVEREQVIPLPEEELKVGKRATETVKHIRTYVVEEPVQRDVQLRDERTVIEKRPATGTPQGRPVEREYEVRERHEEPVVQKDVRAGEELVVRKEAQERTETVADTVKKTKSDIDKTGR